MLYNVIFTFFLFLLIIRHSWRSSEDKIVWENLILFWLWILSRFCFVFFLFFRSYLMNVLCDWIMRDCFVLFEFIVVYFCWKGNISIYWRWYDDFWIDLIIVLYLISRVCQMLKKSMLKLMRFFTWVWNRSVIFNKLSLFGGKTPSLFCPSVCPYP